MSKKFMVFYFIGYLMINFICGCASTWQPSSLPDYETQKRIVWQGTMDVKCQTEIEEISFQAIFFGYDRNHNYTRNGLVSPCKGIDLIEFKRVFANGHWNYKPFLMISDDNFDCHADHGWLDCDQDGSLETIVVLPTRLLKLETVNERHICTLMNQCH